jgi:hypothetical protein
MAKFHRSKPLLSTEKPLRSPTRKPRDATQPSVPYILALGEKHLKIYGWNDGKDKNYNVPWTPVTAENVDQHLSTRK